MPKELLIYSRLHDFTAETAVNQLNEIPESDDLTIRLNTPGGNVHSGWAIISKMSERSGKTNAVVDGMAMSMGAMMLPFFDKVISNDTSRIMFHKAAYSSWYEPSESELKQLKSINAQFKEKLAKKVSGKNGAQKFLDKVFESDIRNDVELTPTEAKQLGIVDEVRKLEPKAEYIGSEMVALVDIESKKIESKPPKEELNILKLKKMDKATLLAEHPAVYAEILALGKKAGVATELDRVGAWAVFNDIDPDGVKAGIESGEAITNTQAMEFNKMYAKAGIIEAQKKDNPDALDTKLKDLTPEQIQAKKDSDALNKELGELKAE